MPKPKYPNSVVVLETSIGERLFIRSNPSDADVRRYVKEQSRRHKKHEKAGPGHTPAYLIYDSALRYESEDLYYAGAESVGVVKVSDIIPKS